MSAKTRLAVVEAFHRAFGERGHSDIGLVVKTLDAGPHAGALKKLKSAIGGDKRIHLIEKTMSRPEVNGLIAATDAFVSLHRSEGFGFGLAEAMLLGKPAIGTDYSGNTDFLFDATGYPVPYELVPVGAGEYPDHEGQVWAEPDIAAAARAMAAIIDDPVAAETRALAGQAFIKTHHSLAAVGRQMRDRLVTLGVLKEMKPDAVLAAVVRDLVLEPREQHRIEYSCCIGSRTAPRSVCRRPAPRQARVPAQLRRRVSPR